ncbi:FAD-binding oxidoreductase [Tenggerimyces flavus]|uniref:FAD-binding oxidoreductase n=1 Tax=Tenggerimyces flavus TaxID=1708749 RepID=A0ABV7Y9H3_9ACTN|nr:FAD-binding oxidoreductase [Tenggerimyces flavus]MBM7786665.1 FAD/FMN-containing dehydrogenase [Tenggerimyces flavus]
MTNELYDTLSGTVVRAGDEDYARLSKTFAHTGEPAAIVRCHSPADVQQAVRLAADNDLVLSIRSGGHSNAGFSTNDGGLVIDLSPLDGVEVLDAAEGTVRLGAGATWETVADTLTPHGLAFTAGDSKPVGVGGLLLGAGIGWMVRKYGLSIDNLLAAELVLASGELVRVSSTERPDLFWAIRGGGGNFGIAVAFEVQARHLDGVHFGPIMFPRDLAADVVKGWARAMRAAPPELTSTINLLPAFGPDGPPPVMIRVCYAGTDADAAAKAIEPIRQLGPVLSDEVKAMPYADILEGPFPAPPGWSPLIRNVFVGTLSDELVDLVTTRPAKLGLFPVELRWIGGALNDVPADATAFGHRDIEVMLSGVSLGAPDAQLAVAADVKAFWDAVGPLTVGAYGNFLTHVDEASVRDVYPPATLARLAAIKREVDPTNLFRRNVNIQPAV